MTKIKDIPFREILKLVKNIMSIDFKKTAELLFRVIFSKIQPTENFDILLEIEQIEDFSRTNIFKKLYAKRIFLSLKYLKAHYPKLNVDKNEIENLSEGEKETILRKIHTDYLPYLILFHDKWIFLAMDEVMGIFTMLKFTKKLLNSAPRSDFNKLAFLISNFEDVPILKKILGGAKGSSQTLPGSNESLFNMSVKSDESKNSAKFSFTFSSYIN